MSRELSGSRRQGRGNWARGVWSARCMAHSCNLDPEVGGQLGVEEEPRILSKIYHTSLDQSENQK